VTRYAYRLKNQSFKFFTVLTCNPDFHTVEDYGLKQTEKAGPFLTLPINDNVLAKASDFDWV